MHIMPRDNHIMASSYHALSLVLAQDACETGEGFDSTRSTLAGSLRNDEMKRFRVPAFTAAMGVHGALAI